MKPPQPPDSLRQEKCTGGFVETDARLLETAVEKLVRFGRQVGVTPEEMVSLLDSGISIHDLLVLIASKSSGTAQMGASQSFAPSDLQLRCTGEDI